MRIRETTGYSREQWGHMILRETNGDQWGLMRIMETQGNSSD